MTNHQFDCDRESQNMAQTTISVSTQGSSDPCFVSCRCRSEDKKSGAELGKLGRGKRRGAPHVQPARGRPGQLLRK